MRLMGAVFQVCMMSCCSWQAAAKLTKVKEGAFHTRTRGNPTKSSPAQGTVEENAGRSRNKQCRGKGQGKKRMEAERAPI